jgi:hypothetical protein
MKNIVAFSRNASTDRLPQLNHGERLFLWGFRAMAQHHRCGRPIIAAMQQVYAQFHVEDAVASLDAMIETFARTAHTAIEVHSPCCPCVSASETLLLRAVAAAQSGTLDVARRTFERWLPELGTEWILGAVCGIGRLFQAAGMTLPLRDAGTTKMSNTATAQSWPIETQALH